MAAKRRSQLARSLTACSALSTPDFSHATEQSRDFKGLEAVTLPGSQTRQKRGPIKKKGGALQLGQVFFYQVTQEDDLLLNEF